MNSTVRVYEWPARSVRVIIAGDLAFSDGREALREVRREWERLCAINPRLHDGRVLHVESFDAVRGEIVCRRTTYKTFVAGHAAGVRVEALGVTGICVRNGAGGEEVLVGRRGENVRIYAGLWETAPRGAVEPPTAGDVMSFDDLAGCLVREGIEELGADVVPRACVGLVRDAAASSLDVCVRCEGGSAGDGGNWEYASRRWMRMDVLRAWARGRPPAGLEGQTLSPPCEAWFRA